MATQWNGDRELQRLEVAAARGLLAAATRFANELRIRVSVPNPPPHTNSSRPGEYPRLRTGGGQKAIAIEPATIDAIRQAGRVRVGYRPSGVHMLILEFLRGRLGLQRTLEDLRAELAKLAKAAMR